MFLPHAGEILIGALLPDSWKEFKRKCKMLSQKKNRNHRMTLGLLVSGRVPRLGEKEQLSGGCSPKDLTVNGGKLTGPSGPWFPHLQSDCREGSGVALSLFCGQLPRWGGCSLEQKGRENGSRSPADKETVYMSFQPQLHMGIT